jgi:hypothetical protein
MRLDPWQTVDHRRNNTWMLSTALAWGPKTVRFIALWDGEGGDGPGGTEHMYRTVQDHAGQVYHLDTTNSGNGAPRSPALNKDALAQGS